MCNKMMVRIMTREHIKPDSATPKDKQCMKLSLLDQLTFPMSGPYFLFYPHAADIAVKSHLLKSSLSKVLTLYYPLAAGELEANSVIKCNDVGLEYIEAHVSCPMSHFLRRPDLENSNFLISPPLTKDQFTSGVIQVNFFSCGGVAIGLSVSHKIMDGVSICNFLLAWATTNSTGRLSGVDLPYFASDTIIPSLDESVFPPSPDTQQTPSGLELDTVKYPTRRYVFEASKVRLLKDRVATEGVQRPTRVEVVTALIWKCLMAASSKTKYSVVMHAVNLRRRFSPPLPQNYVGNLTGRFLTEPKTKDDADLAELVTCLRRGLTKNLAILEGSNVPEKEELVASIIDFAKELANYMNGRENVELYSFSSLCGYPFYEVDFGWGKPAWGSYTNLGVKNFGMMLDASDGEGVEVCLSVSDDVATLLERDTELLEFASVNPSPCGLKVPVILRSSL